MEDEEKYGIDIDHAHERAIELIPEDLFGVAVINLRPLFQTREAQL